LNGFSEIKSRFLPFEISIRFPLPPAAAPRNKSNKHYIFWVCVYIRRYLTSKARAPCYRLWLICLYRIFDISRKRHDFRGEGRNIKHKMCFDYNFVWNISHSKKNSARCFHYVHTCSCLVSVIFASHFMRREFPWQSFHKYSDIKFQGNPSSGSHEGRQTYVHGEANSRFSQFCECVLIVPRCWVIFRIVWVCGVHEAFIGLLSVYCDFT